MTRRERVESLTYEVSGVLTLLLLIVSQLVIFAWSVSRVDIVIDVQTALYVVSAIVGVSVCCLLYLALLFGLSRLIAWVIVRVQDIRGKNAQ